MVQEIASRINDNNLKRFDLLRSTESHYTSVC